HVDGERRVCLQRVGKLVLYLAAPGVTSFSYTLQANATFTIDVKYQFTYGDPKHSLLSIATSSVFVDGNRQPSGFEGLKIDATVPLLNLDMPASYSDWHLTTFTP
ncbi:MAG TPA: hypothetical protein PKO06_22435, partial [Candidatus Ozemobacteraceae bacterium]|nr:hypothetical protein [Candidatus Ozemobacteraceae bacterium]